MAIPLPIVDVTGGRVIPKDDAGRSITGVILAPRGVVTNVDSADPVVIPIPFSRTAEIKRVVVEKTAGSAATFTVTFRDKLTDPDTLNVVFEYTDVVTLIDQAVSLLYVNEDDPIEDLIYLVIAPNAGADNDFKFRIWGEVKT